MHTGKIPIKTAFHIPPQLRHHCHKKKAPSNKHPTPNKNQHIVQAPDTTIDM